MSKAACYFAIICALAAPLAPAREWTNRAGQQIEADFVDLVEGRVLLKQVNGPEVVWSQDDLSDDDRAWLRAELVLRDGDLRAYLAKKPSAIVYGPGRELCKIESAAVRESSGLCCSRRQTGVFWTHNDSGDDARLYAFDTKGRDLGSCLLDGVTAFDFEDIASVTLDGKSLLLVGDIGNNSLAAPVQMIHVVEEPGAGRRRPREAADRARAANDSLRFDDDNRNCEALGVDPASRTILVISKERTRECYVYAFVWPAKDAKRASIARKIATLKLPTVTALDISPDGRRAMVGTYGHAYEFARTADEEWRTAFSRRPNEVILPERRQGEGLCYGPDGKTLYLTSEKEPAPLWEVPVK